MCEYCRGFNEKARVPTTGFKGLNNTHSTVLFTMSKPYDIVYNRIMDITAVVHIPIKIFTLVIVVRYTPPSMRYLSMFLLNGFLWNFVANIMMTFLHPYPMFPAQCFRIDGWFSSIGGEVFRHVMFFFLIICMLNITLANVLTFAYRLCIFHYSDDPTKIRIWRSVATCVASYLGVFVLAAMLYYYSTVSTAAYPLKEELPESEGLFCLKPYGLEKTFTVVLFVVGVVTKLVCVFVLTILLLRRIAKKSGTMQQNILDKHREILWILIMITIVPQNILDKHREILWILIMITIVPVVFGCIPLLVVTATLYNPRLPYGSEIFMACFVVLANHGSLYAVALIVALKPYRDATRRIISNIRNFKLNNGIATARLLFVPRGNE
uniref:G_PROTEIN_RECEP_F1_2 domain-containing protein n=1 Tax=Steinernema glaseri TaxID=37863 RepID=A0A1I8AGY9_9BILA